MAFGLLAAAVVTGAGTTPTTSAAESAVVLADFEGGLSSTFFTYNGGGAGVGFGVETVADSDALAVPGQVGDNDILSVGFDVPAGGFGGFGDDFSSTGSQDWSAFDGLRF